MNTTNTKGALVALALKCGAWRDEDGDIGMTEDGLEAFAAALQAHSPPAPAVASGGEPQQCGLCGEVEAFTGTCGGGRDNPRALCFEGPEIDYDAVDRIVDAARALGGGDPDGTLTLSADELRGIVGTALAATPPAATKVPRLPDAVSQWVEAYRVYVEAIDRYNVRLAAIRERERLYPDEFGRDSPQAEWDAWHNAERKARALIMPMYEALRSPAAHGATTRETAWQPIETAPKDRLVLVCIAGLDHSTGEAWIENGWWRTHDGVHPRVTTYTTPPTHWQPIPPPPAARKVTPPSAQQEGAV